jgi:RNA polymerase sigma-70 factor (ECF subfamily)
MYAVAEVNIAQWAAEVVRTIAGLWYDRTRSKGVAIRMTQTSEESLLIQRLRAGEDRAFELLVTQYGPRMLSVARRYLRDESDAQDALQDAFISVFKNISRFEETSALATWLHTIVVRASLMKLRSAKTHDRPSIDELLPAFDGNQDHRLGHGGKWQGSLDDALTNAELKQQVRAAIDRLPEIYRVVVLLRDIEELDGNETARLLGVTPSVVKTRLHRARQALRTLLDPALRQEWSTS